MTSMMDEKGFALITTLMLLVLGMGLLAVLILAVTSATKVSGMEGNYTACLEAAKGGAEAIVTMVLNDLQTPDSVLGASVASGSNCLKDKMEKRTSQWASCTSGATQPDATVSPDLIFNLGGYLVRVKIFDTRETASYLYYSIIVLATAPGANDRAEISFLYQRE